MVKRGTGGRVLLARRVGVVAAAAAASAIAIAAVAGGWLGREEGELVDNDDDAGAEARAGAEAGAESPPSVLADVDVRLLGLLLGLVLNTDTLVFTFETGEGSINTGGCSDDRTSAEPGVLGPTLPTLPAAAAAAVTGVSGESGDSDGDGDGDPSRPRPPARARSSATCEKHKARSE